MTRMNPHNHNICIYISDKLVVTIRHPLHQIGNNRNLFNKILDQWITAKDFPFSFIV